MLFIRLSLCLFILKCAFILDNGSNNLEEAGIEPTIDLLEALQDVDAESLQKLATNFGEQQAAL